MLYLEDYLEMIEHLPSELRDRFTELREMDLSVQNRVDSLEERQKVFFSQCTTNCSTFQSEEEFVNIKKEYSKVIDEANEKIQISEECYGLVDRYLRKLDQELHKFKMELEADNRGITEILEKKSLELDLPTANSHKENRHPKKVKKAPMNLNQMLHRKHSLGVEWDSANSPSSDSQSSTSAGLASSLNRMFPLQHMGPGGNAIAVAASQAIAATQQLTSGRRTSSLKASFEAINLGLQSNEFTLGRDLANAAASAHLASGLPFQGDVTLAPPPNKKKKGSSSTSRTTAAAATATSTNPGTPLLDVDTIFNPDFVPEDSPSDLFNLNAADTDLGYDPNEPRYCVCNQVSYGDMVACDNQDCPYEWFHYPCVGITSVPKGKWYCPSCLTTMTRRKGRK